MEPDARDPARRLRARRLRSRAAERRAAGAEGGVAELLAKHLRGLRLPGGVSPEVRRRSERPPCASTSSPRSSRPRKGTTNVKNISVGSLFTLERCPRADQNREHLVVAATYDMEYSDYEAMPERGGAEYRCSFVAMSSKQQFRPKRLTPKPFVQGPQTAVVVGPGGRGDLHRQVRPREGAVPLGPARARRRRTRTAPCWVRVSQPWAGKAWGGVTIPRIGQEVIVDFLEGDPDQPIITGRVYNAEQMPPYALPANMTQSGIKSRSSKGGTPDNFNEIRFEDKKGVGAGLHPRREEPGHRGRERRDPLGGARPEEDDRQRRDDARQARPDGDGRQQRDDHDWRQSNRERRQERDDRHRRQSNGECRQERDDLDRQESHRERRRERDHRYRERPVD